jgi:outer membrane receptor protein involved in Fe transport
VWTPLVGHAGVELQAARPLRLFVNYDNSFRAPNLDDMTSRQQTGPGFQFENAALEPEETHTFEVGGRVRLPWLLADAWLFETLLEHGIIKVSKELDDCPQETPQCQGSWARFQLQNAPTLSELRGAEGAARFTLPAHVTVRATISYVWSEGPRVGTVAKGVYGVVLGERVPLSKTPPLNGTVEVSWTHASGFAAGAALQWAAEQDRLAIADYSDGRIPKYGTPGFAVVHLRASYRMGRQLLLAAVVENLFDAPYRFHGSSVNGAGRGLMVQLEAAPF